MKKEKLLKIDMHVHSIGVSRCSHVTCEEIIDEKIKLGYDGVVLTNHCQAWYYPPEEHKQYIEKVISEFQRGKRYAEEKGFQFYLGLEVSLEVPHYADWLLYGVTEEFLRASPCLYSLTQKELYDLCNQWGILLIQAHPYRQTPCDPQYMHDIEINCTGGDLNKIPLVEEFAKEHGLLITCGTDYHAADRIYHGGVYISAECQTATDIVAYLRKEKKTRAFLEKEDREYF